MQSHPVMVMTNCLRHQSHSTICDEETPDEEVSYRRGKRLLSLLSQRRWGFARVMQDEAGKICSTAKAELRRDVSDRIAAALQHVACRVKTALCQQFGGGQAAALPAATGQVGRGDTQ